jgi:hypothetical protein
LNAHLYDEKISILLIRWQEIKNELTELFKRRESKKTLIPMQEGIEHFYNFLFWTNDLEKSTDEKAMLELKWKPVNTLERLSFIKNRPNLYHSFIQLTELMNEQEKQFNKKKAIEKVTKQ